MAIWFTSDHHFGHANIIKYTDRPFRDLEHMDEQLVQNWNQCIRPEDTVFYLGDFSLKGPDKIGFYLDRLNFSQMYFIRGNHDRKNALKHISPSMEWIKKSFYLDPEKLETGLPKWLKDKAFILTHDRYKPDTPYCDAKKRKPCYRLHGHSHAKLPNNSVAFDVGIDSCAAIYGRSPENYRPFEFNELCGLFYANLTP